MTRKEASELWQIIKAYGEGKTIQEKHIGSSTDVWTDMHEMEELDLNDSYWEYRIKPEEKNLCGECIDSDKEIDCGKCDFQKKLEGTIFLKCWKCGKEKPISEMSNICYPSNPPKYSCKTCEETITIEQNAENNQIEGGVVSSSGSVEKQYRPFKDCSELIMITGTKLLWVKHKKLQTVHLITAFGKIQEYNMDVVEISNMNYSMKELLESWEFLDSSPIGIAE